MSLTRAVAEATSPIASGPHLREGTQRPCPSLSSTLQPPTRAVDLSLDIQTAQNVPLALEPASIGERVLATIVDLVVMVAWVTLVAGVVFDVLGVGGSLALGVVLIAVPVTLYHLAFEVFFEGRTPGKMLLKTQVARVDGAQPTLGQYLLRWLIRFVDVTATSGVGALVSVALTKRSQRLGDLAAGTTVVRRRQRVRLGEVLYPAVPADYAPAFPEAADLTDADVRTLRAVLVRLRISKRDARASALARRAKAAVERRLDLGPVDMPAEPFLKAVVRDHVFLMDRYGGG